VRRDGDFEGKGCEVKAEKGGQHAVEPVEPAVLARDGGHANAQEEDEHVSAMGWPEVSPVHYAVVYAPIFPEVALSSRARQEHSAELDAEGAAAVAAAGVVEQAGVVVQAVAGTLRIVSHIAGNKMKSSYTGIGGADGPGGRNEIADGMRLAAVDQQKRA
jgi:hypothetical protein